MKNYLVACMMLALSNSSCSVSPSQNDSSVSGAKQGWEKVLECQNGAVIVDVDTNNRRSLQVVVRDSSLFSYFDSKLSVGQVKTQKERIYKGQTSQGVFRASNFVNVFEYKYVSGKQLGFEARLYGNTLTFRALDFEATQCGGSLRGNDYSSCEVANYIFRNCHQ